MFLACMFSYVIRTNLSIIIVAMVQPTNKAQKGPQCLAGNVTGNSSKAIEDVRKIQNGNKKYLQCLKKDNILRYKILLNCLKCYIVRFEMSITTYRLLCFIIYIHASIDMKPSNGYNCIKVIVTK